MNVFQNMSQRVETITVVTYNLWGIFNSKHREARMAHFAEKVGRYDVMLLQEQFAEDDFNLIINSLPQAVRESRYFRRFPSAFYGSGIAVISRYPINSAFFYTYPLQGFPERVFHGDYYANKGVALVRVNVPIRTSPTGAEAHREILLYVTHLVAMYEKSAQLLDWRHELYLSVRLSQAICMADFITETSKPTESIIIAGDFNCTQKSLELQTMLILLRRRGYQLKSVIPPTSAAPHTTVPADEQALMTYSHENVFNSAEDGWFVNGSDVPVQIDHMFFSANTLSLRPYEDCPDAPPQYPFIVEERDRRSPSGVVIFKSNEVQVTARLSTREKFSNWLRAQGRKLRSNALMVLASWIATPRTSTNGDPSVDLVPMSDHYGVAARIDLEGSENEQKDIECNSIVPLTERDELLLRESTTFLSQSVQRLSSESRAYFACSVLSAAIVVGNILLLMYRARGQQEYTARVLEQLHTVSTLSAVATPMKLTQEDATKTSSVLNWVQKALHFTGISKPQQNVQEMPLFEASQVDYAEIAARIHSGGALETIQPIVTIIGSLVSLGTLIIGLLQRRGDSNCLAEQVRRLKREGF